MRASDGADRMLLLGSTVTLAWVHLSTTSQLGAELARLAAAGLLATAYFEAGLVKVLKPRWRNGTELASIMAMKSVGNRWVATFVLERTKTSLALSWAVMSLELSAGPLLIIGGVVGLVTAMALTAMHLAIAVLMGLGRFFYPFVSLLLLVSTGCVVD